MDVVSVGAIDGSFQTLEYEFADTGRPFPVERHTSRVSDTLFGAVDERRYHRGQRAVGRRSNVHLSAGANGTFAPDVTDTIRRQFLASHEQQETD